MTYTLITGASAGLGAEFAHQLAAEKRNLILSARRTDKLEQLAKDLEQKHGITCQVIPADLADAQGAAQLADAIEQNGWELSGLVNNAGFGDNGAFTHIPRERQLAMLQVNITALTELCHRLIPMLTQQRDSFLINVASIAAFQAGPHMATYYASKAYVLSLTEALAEELKEAGVKVSCLCPGPTHTEFAAMADIESAKLFQMGAMQADEVVRYSLANRDTVIAIPGAKNRVLANVTKVSPRAIARKLAFSLQRRKEPVKA